jgi:hypothetical protein
MMYKLKNNIVRVDASSKLIPNERPSRNNNEQALRIPSCKTTLWYRLVTYRAALLWTILNRWMSFCWYVSYTELAYSRVGLTRDTYAFSCWKTTSYELMHQASLYQMNAPPETTTSRHCAFHHARPQLVRIRSILERSRNGTPCLSVLSLPLVLNFNGHRQLVDYSATFWVCALKLEHT